MEEGLALIIFNLLRQQCLETACNSKRLLNADLIKQGEVLLLCPLTLGLSSALIPYACPSLSLGVLPSAGHVVDLS